MSNSWYLVANWNWRNYDFTITKFIDCKPTYATLPLPGIQPILLDNEGNEILENNIEGNLCIKYLCINSKTTYGDHKRCKETCFSTFKNYYFTGDGAKRDGNGFYECGRVDMLLMFQVIE